MLTVGKGFSRSDWPALATVLQGIQRGAGELGLRLMLEEMSDAGRPPPLLKSRQVDGVIVLLADSASAAEGEQAFRTITACVPAVWAMGTTVACDNVDLVSSDDPGIGHLAASHLVGKGCRRLAFLTADPARPGMRLRGQAFLNWATDAGVELTAVYLGQGDGRTPRAYSGAGEVVAEDGLCELVAAVAASARAPAGKLGLFVGDDLSMAIAHPMLVASDLRWGEELEVVSCDGDTARLDMLNPRPASIDIGAEEIGFRAVVRLLARIKRPQDRTISIRVVPRL